MELYIRIKNGQPFEHPITAENFHKAFSCVDTNNLPSGFARFERVEKPTLGAYQVYEGSSYGWVDGVVKDVHHIRLMEEEEKKEKQNKVKTHWANEGFPSWVFDEVTCSFQPPTPHPADGKLYDWDETTASWRERLNGASKLKID